MLNRQPLLASLARLARGRQVLSAGFAASTAGTADGDASKSSKAWRYAGGAAALLAAGATASSIAVAAEAPDTSASEGKDGSVPHPKHESHEGWFHRFAYKASGWMNHHAHDEHHHPPHHKGHPSGYEAYDAAGLPIVQAVKTSAPDVPPPVGRRNYPVHQVLDLTSLTETMQASPLHKYNFWTFDGTVPGPMVRCRVGDVLEVRFTNKDRDEVGHNLDFHCVTGPGGGAPVTYAEAGETKVATFKLLYPGLYIYHCAAAPVPVHIANGMYGLVLVEPEHGLPPVDKEYYVMQSEIYAEVSKDDKTMLEHSYPDGLLEHPLYVVFNGSMGSLTEKPIVADQGDRVRIYFGNAGPNLVSSFHIIGTIFDKVYREGDLISPPARGIQTTLVPSGGATVVEVVVPVPGNFTLVDHSIFRIDKGAVGFLKVRPRGNDKGKAIYDSTDYPQPCPGCKLHN